MPVTQCQWGLLNSVLSRIILKTSEQENRNNTGQDSSGNNSIIVRYVSTRFLYSVGRHVVL